MKNQQVTSQIMADIQYQVSDSPKSDGIDIIFQNISFFVQVKDQNEDTKISFLRNVKQKQILKNVSGIFKSGKATAIMGASGAGKTTLLNILACRINPDEGGKLYANNFQYNHKSFGDFANYVMQTDRLMETLTVRQTLQFAAKLKLNTETMEGQKLKVEELVKKMKLQKCLDTLVGGVILKGISGGQKKRVSIAFELISDPKVIFLDEPTSGLDSLTSYIIVSELRKLAHRQNKTVVMTIHQPGSETFQLFDNLMLLLDGRIMYQNDSSLITNYFQKNFNLQCPEFTNPPDYFMAQIHFEKEQNREKFSLFFEVYDTSELPKISQTLSQKSQIAPLIRNTSVPYLVALNALLQRSMINTLRNPYIVHAKLIQVLFMAVYTGGIYFRMGKKDYTNQQAWASISGFFFCVSIASVTMSIPPIALTFPQERLVFLKQQDNRMYNTTQYFIAKNIIQLPEHIILPMMVIPIYYFMICCAPTAEQFFLHCLICCLMSFCGASIGLFIGSVIMDWKDIPVVIPIFLLPMIAFSGFFKNRQDLPVWCGWMEYVSPNKYSFIGLLENEVKYKDSLIQRFHFDIPKWETVWLMLILGLSFRTAALLCLWLFRKRTQ